ncbi:hypothetical protein EON65_17715 [archaeon]|nr:MAG: hypothetical protein EON65_17715 [archaeon]
MIEKKRRRKSPNNYDALYFPGAVDDPGAEVETYTDFNHIIRRAAAGLDYDGTKHTYNIILPPFSLRMNAYEKLIRQFFHIHNHHDIEALRIVVRHYGKSDMSSSFLHQSTFINPTGLPNYIQVHGLEDFLNFIGLSFMQHPDSIFLVEEAFNKAVFARQNPGRKIVVCKTKYLSTLTLTFPVRKSLQTILNNLSIQSIDNLTKEQIVLIQGLEACKRAFKNPKTNFSYEQRSGVDSSGNSTAGSASMSCSPDDSSPDGPSNRKRSTTSSTSSQQSTTDEYKDFMHVPQSPANSSEGLTAELGSLLCTAQTFFQMQHAAATGGDAMQTTFLKEEEYVFHTLYIPITKQLITYFEFDEQDKVVGVRFTYHHLPTLKQ